jgi:Protein of unknown function (DUF416)
MTIKSVYIEMTCNLSRQKQLIFGLLAAERFVNCYKIFHEKEDFGNATYMMEAIGIIERITFEETKDSELVERCIKLVYENIPHTDGYGSLGGTLSLNVGGIIYETLNLSEHFEERRLSDISTMCTDSIDFIILEIEDYDQMDFARIASHDLMKEEVQLQKGIIKYLETISNVYPGDIETLRLMQKERKFDELNLEQILYS